MRSVVRVYGGFSQTEATWETRNWETNTTTLDGDSVLDGFVITGGSAGSNINIEDNHGGGMYNDGVSPIVENCHFLSNDAPGDGSGPPGYGGAIYTSGGTLTITESDFVTNMSSGYSPDFFGFCGRSLADAYSMNRRTEWR